MAHVHAGLVGAEALLGAEVRDVDEAGAAVVTTLGELAVKRVSSALPVRRIPSHAGQRHRPGLFWSATTGGHVPYESRLELDRLWLADFDPDVVWIAPWKPLPLLLVCITAATGALLPSEGKAHD